MNEGSEEVRRGILTRLKEAISGAPGDYEEDYDDEDIQFDTRRQPVSTLRLQPSSKVSHVGLKYPQSLEEARLAADGLKDGRQQIVNLEKTDQQTSERIIDFLYGVTYALNGFVEKVGDRVYLFAPCNVVIEVQNEAQKSAVGFMDRNS